MGKKLAAGTWMGLLVQFVDLRPRVTIADQAINDRTLAVACIPWAEIADAYLKSIINNHFVCLVVRDPTMCSKSLPPTEETMLKANLGLGMSELNINLSGTNANPVEKFMHESSNSPLLRGRQMFSYVLVPRAMLRRHSCTIMDS